MRRTILCMLMLIGLLGPSLGRSAALYDSQDYDLYPGDFNGDGYADILYVAKTPGAASGIALSTSSSPPSATDAPWQSWPSNYLGIQWWGNAYNIIVADFNGDGKSDLLLQAKTAGGTSYLLLGQGAGTFTTISQSLSNGTGGVNWSADQQAIVAGVFSSAHPTSPYPRAGVVLQASSPSGNNYVMLTDGNGLFTQAPEQSWQDGFLSLNWSTRDAVLYAADFNGDTLSDLLVQQKPKWVEIDYDVPFPIPTFAPAHNGIAFAGNATAIFGGSAQTWSRQSNGVDWSPLAGNLIVGDFSNDGCADVLFQAKSSSKSSYLLTASNCKSTGPIFPSSTNATAISSNVALSASSAKLVAGNYGGASSATQLYIQATSPSGTDYIATAVGATTTASTHDLTRPSASQPPVPATAIGRTPGSGFVLPDGSGSYSIFVELPPGTANLTPKLSFDYRSGGPDGLLGVGWTLAGLSAISRCPATYAQDGTSAAVSLQASDQYCLDGMRLRLYAGSTQGADGSQYGTEIEKFSLVIAHGTTGYGPAWFEVRGANGLIYEYGNTADSQIPVLGTSIPRTWALNKIRDRRTNYISFSYYNATAYGSYEPYRIQYTGNENNGVSPQYTIQFTYEPRSPLDQSLAYFAGSPIREANQLLSVDVSGSAGLIRKYVLGYNTPAAAPQDQRIHLTSVQQCDGTGTNCMGASTFGWQSPPGPWSTSPSSTDANTLAARVVFLDLNGDGIPDALWSEPPNYNLACFALGTRYGFGGKTCSASIPFFYNGTSPSRWTVVSRQFVFDYKGDGRQEFAQYNTSTQQWEMLALNSSNNGLVEQALSFPPDSYGLADVTGSSVVAFADLDGDGRDDLIYFSSADTGGNVVYPYGIRVRLSNGAGFGAAQLAYDSQNAWLQRPIPCAILRGHFSGSGRSDLIIDRGNNCSSSGADTPWEVYTPSGTSQSLTLAHTADIPLVSPYSWPPILADFNGDGLDDVAYMQYSGSNVYLYAMLGTGSPTAPLSARITTNIQIPNVGQVFAADYDGDGRADIVFGNGTWYVARSSGDPNTTGGLFPSSVSTQISASGSSAGAIGLDVEGRGLTDLVTFPSSGSGPLSVYSTPGPYPDLMTSASDIYGNGVQFAYNPLTVTSLYTKDSTAQFPSYDYEGPRYVVTAETLTDGIGGYYGLGYSYGGAQVDRQGRGFLGFARVYIWDTRTLFDEERQYALTFPKTGMLIQEDVWQGNNNPVRHTVITPNVQTVSAAALEQRYFPYVQQRTDLLYEVSPTSSKDGQPITSSLESYSYDSYGNLVTDTRTVTDVDASAPASPYNGKSWTAAVTNTPDIDPNGTLNSADVSAWCTALINKTVVAYSSTQDGSAVTRTTQFIPDTDPNQCRIAHVVVEPGNSKYQVTEDLGFDGFGNVNSETVTGAGMTPRGTGLYWGTTGHFLQTVTNALSQTTTFGFDSNFGRLNSYVDPNGITTSWHYDTFGRKDAETRPDHTKTTWSYNACATLGCVNSNNQMIVTTNVLNADGSLQSTQNTYFDSLERPLVISAVTASGAYDRTEAQYDNFGRIHQQSAPCFWSGCVPSWTTYSYDTVGRLIQAQQPTNASNSTLKYLIYQYFGRTERITDANGYITTQVHDVNGWLRLATDAKGYAVTRGYDAAGANNAVSDSLGNTLFAATYDYGLQALQTDATDMDLDVSTAIGQHHHYAYDALGELQTRTDAKGQSLSVTYDALGRAVTRTEPDLFTKWTWGTGAINGTVAYNIGQLQSVCTATVTANINAGVCDAGGYSESSAYDSYGRLFQSSIAIPSAGTFNYGLGYDSNTGLLSTLTYPTSTAGYALQLQYGYSNGVLQSIQDVSDSSSVTIWKANAVNPAGQVLQQTLGNGVVVSRNFDAVTGWLATVQAGLNGSAALQNQGYLYDNVGNLTQRQDNNLGLTENIYPDVLNRFDHSTGPSALQMHYDAMGNISSRSDIAGGAVWSYDPVHKHRVITAGDSSHTYTYDNNGNAITRNGLSIGWSTYNYPTSISSGSGSTAETLTFSYGPARQRWRQVYTGNGITETTNYIGDLLEEVSTSGGATDFRHYVYAGVEPVAVYSRQSTGTNTWHYFLSDHQGSIAGITDAQGASIVKESYSPFGARRNPATWSGPPTNGDLTAAAGVTRQGYTFQTGLGLWTGLNHLNGRVEDAVTGRFLSPDPVVPDISNTQDYNRYGYVNNNPLSLIDPSGLDDTSFCAGADCFNLNLPSLLPPPLPVQVGTYTSFGKIGTITVESLGASIPELLSPGIDFNSLNAQLTAHPGYANYLQTQFPASLFDLGALNGLRANSFDEVTLLLGGYFERPTAAAIPGGEFIVNTPLERFYAGVDPAGTAGLEQAQIDMAIMVLASFVGPEGGAGAAPALAEREIAYSVAFETRLAESSYPGLSRGAHFQEANEALISAMENDAEFAIMMRQGGVNLQRTPTGLAPRTPPDGWTWHHAQEPGVMQLVPRAQHTPGSPFWDILHPGGKGGYATWGK